MNHITTTTTKIRI